jgi:hypothetical protein
MSTEEPTAIDEKIAEEEGSTAKKADWPEFFKKFGSGIITGILIGVVFIGSIGLFLTKVADANILPTDIEALPYSQGKIRQVPVDLIYMNPVKNYDFFGLGFWDEPTSYNIQEANFINTNGLNFLDDFKNTWLCSLLAKSEPKGLKSAFWTFEYESLASNLCMSFTILQKIFFYLNYLPEWATMILFALFFSVIIIIINVCNFFYSLFSHISHIPALFDHVISPQSLNETASDNHGFDILFAYFWFYIYLIIGFWSAILSPIFITLYTFYKALSANYYVRMKEQSDPPQKMNLFSFIKNVLYYKKTFIIILVMFNLMTVANEYLGSSYMPGVVIAILILIFGMKILVTDVPAELYAVTNAVFPPLSQKSVSIIDTDINLCSGTVPKIDIDALTASRVGVTGQPFNVLNLNQADNKMRGGTKFGTKGKSKFGTKFGTKLKMYNIQLV